MVNEQTEGPAFAAPDDEAKLVLLAAELAVGIETHFEVWLLAAAASLLPAGSDPAAAKQVLETVGEVANRVVREVSSLLSTDIDQQRANPLAVVRASLGPVGDALAAAGAPAPVRDPFDKRIHPTDIYDLGPASFGEIHPDLHLPGLLWGAAKAHVHLARRAMAGQR